MLPAAHRPQLCINIVYLNTMGFEDADPIAIFSFVMSIFSLLFNFGLGYKEMVQGSDEPTFGARV